MPFTLTTSIGSEIKKGDGYWEIVIPTQLRPLDHRVQIFASAGEQSGDSIVMLEDSVYIQATIDLAPRPSPSIRGIVKDMHGMGVLGAHVVVPGYTDGVTTDRSGGFEIPSHSVEGQMVTVRAEKDGWAAQETLPVGATADLTLEKVR